jgi:hypothetical protein
MGVNVQLGILRTQEQTLNEHEKIIGSFSRAGIPVRNNRQVTTFRVDFTSKEQGKKHIFNMGSVPQFYFPLRGAQCKNRSLRKVLP